MADAPTALAMPFAASEEHFRLLVSAVKDYAIIMLDPNGLILTWNEGARRLKGYEPNEIIGQPMTRLYPPEALAAGTPARLLAEAVRDGRTEDEGWRVRKDGSRFFADVVLTAMRDAATGALVGFAKITRDITERIRHTEEQRIREELLNRAQRLAHVGSDTRNPITGERQWSDECYRIFGVSRDSFEPTAENVLQLIHPDDRAMIVEQRDQIAAGICPKPFEYRILLADGTQRRVYREWEFMRDADGRPTQLLGTLHDITERRNEEERMRQAQKMEAIGRLAGGMAHDFNNLLGIVITNLDLALEEAGDNAALRELLDEAIGGALRGAEMTRRLLAFARRQPLHPVEIDVNELVDNTTELLSHLLGEDIEISLDLGQGVRPVVADTAQLEACLTHLATNARDAMPKGGRLFIKTHNRELDADYAATHIEVTPGDFSMIEVTDTGTGIPAQFLDQVFEPFFTTKDIGKGTGLGLSMVHGFIKQSGGHVSVYSEEGLGTTFRLYLPSVPAPRPPNGATGPNGPAGRGNGEVVLVVEDNPSLRRAVTRQLHMLGYRVQESDRAEAALDVLSREQVDVLFSDVVTPGKLDGVRLAQQAQERWPDLKIVLTSGFPQERIYSDGPPLAGLQVLVKPYRREELAAAIRAALSH